jgi:tyrosyl-tRNA synthetase
VVVPAADVVGGQLPPYDDLLVRTGLSKSLSDARRTVGEGGAYANNVRIEDSASRASIGDLHHGEWLVLRRGKKAFAGVRVERP